MIPLSVPDLSGNEEIYLQKCIETTFVSSVGQFVGDFEAAVVDVAGASSGVATSSGTSALHLALATLRVRYGDLVILPDYTFIASANAIALAGARPWLVDIDPDNWTLDPRLLKETLETQTAVRDGECIHLETGARVAAIMPVHTLGHPADMDKINIIARSHCIPVIADGAAALGAHYKSRPIGAEADITCLSFNGNKTITSGGGGMVMSSDIELIQRARHLSSTARSGQAYFHDEVAFNYRMTNLQAAVGLAQIERLEQFLAAKRRISQTYREELMDVFGVCFFPESEWATSANWFSGIVLENSDDVDLLARTLKASNIEARPFWQPMHKQPPYEACLKAGPLVVSTDIAPRVLTLPCSTNLLEHEQELVIDVIRRFFKLR